MGSNLVRLAYAFGTTAGLEHAPHRLLVWMCAQAIDDANPPLYYGGFESSAYSLGKMLPPEPAVGDADYADIVRTRARGADLVKKYVKVLRASGAIQLRRHAGPGHAAEYAINLDMEAARKFSTTPRVRGEVTSPQGSEQGETTSTHTGDGDDVWVETSSPIGGKPLPPMGGNLFPHRGEVTSPLLQALQRITRRLQAWRPR